MGASLSPQQQGKCPDKVSNGDKFDHGLSFVGGSQSHITAPVFVFPHFFTKPSFTSASRHR
jgi:hypothetical protein